MTPVNRGFLVHERENVCFTFLNRMGLFQPALEKKNTQEEVCFFGLNALLSPLGLRASACVYVHVWPCACIRACVCT